MKTEKNTNKDANGKKSLILPLILRKGVNVCRWGKKDRDWGNREGSSQNLFICFD